MSFLYGDGHLFWECSYPPLVAVRESPEFHDIVNLNKAGWSRCLLWHGWLPALSGADDGDPWAVDAADVASKRLEVAFGSYVRGRWGFPWLVLPGVARCGVHAHASGAAWFGRV